MFDFLHFDDSAIPVLIIALLMAGIAFRAFAELRRSRAAQLHTQRVALPREALLSHIIANAEPKSGETQLAQIPWAIEQIRDAYKTCASLAEETTLTPAAQWLVDNARLIEEAAVAVNDSLRSAPRLPMGAISTRVEALAEQLTEHSDARIDRELLIAGVRSYQQAHPLTEAELWALPLAVRRELVALAAKISRTCASDERYRSHARLLVNKPDDGRDIVNASVFKKYAGRGVFIEELLSLLLERQDAHALNTIDDYLSKTDRTAKRTSENEHIRQTRLRDLMGNTIVSLKILSSMDWAHSQEELSAVHAALMADPAEIYPKMDFPSRREYRNQLAKLSRTTKRPESIAAKYAVTLAEEAAKRTDESDAGDTEAAIERHVGYYIADDGRPKLMKLLGGWTIWTKCKRFAKKHSSVVFILSLALLDAGISYGAYWLGAPIWAILISLPLVGEASRTIIHKTVNRLSQPPVLPRLAPEHVIGRTLVVIPTLLTSPKHALDMVRHLSTLRFANPHKSLDYMLLSDFTDSDTQTKPEDDTLIREASSAIDALNQVWGGGYFYIHRNRAWDAGMNRFMGPERKRGMLEMLTSLIVTGEYPADIAYTSIELASLKGKYHSVITLDADTELPPDTALTLVGAITHPLNRAIVVDGKARGYSILQPRMDLSAATVSSKIQRLFAGEGGVDMYVSATADFYQTIANAGSFCGKGVYDPYAFYQAIKGKIRKNTILSHDLLEGSIARAGMLVDVPLYDGEPGSVTGWYKRLHRWTRGDWQLLPWLGGRVRGENGTFRNPIDLLGRFKIYDNLRRSVVPICEILLLVLGIAMSSPITIALALLYSRLGLILRPSLKGIVNTLARFALLPREALNQLDAILRTLGRLFFSHKNMLEWVPSFLAGKDDRTKSPPLNAPSVIAALLTLGASMAPYLLTGSIAYIIAAIPIAAMWLSSVGIERALDAPAWKPEALNERQHEVLSALSEETWRFFDDTVTANTHYLPPDNVQLDPPKGSASRTSPTNIGMYLLSVASAHSLQLISAEDMLAKTALTVMTLERMETWRGHPYNWYDINSLMPLHPRYVSSVDSGNFAICLATAAQAVRVALAEAYSAASSAAEHIHSALPERIERLVDKIDFQALYDDETSLFHIGVETDSGKTSASRYDLLASESRMLSFFSVMRREVPLKHWRSLGRTLTVAPIKRGAKKSGVLLSWAGTAFEYLMPTLLFPQVNGTLLAESNINAALTQIAHTKDKSRPFGVSESGYWAFDPELNYQYKAFGLPELSLRGGAAGEVIAPYASALALAVTPNEAANNIIKMRELGWHDEHGMYEAADWDARRVSPTRSYALVKSHMTHHQGMILCACANALTGNALQKLFCRLPQAEAYSLLLTEKTPTENMLKRAVRPRYRQTPVKEKSIPRTAHPNVFPLAVHLLSGAGTTLMHDARGNGYIAHNGYMLTRWRPDITDPDNGIRFYISIDGARPLPLGTPNGIDSTITYDNGRTYIDSKLIDEDGSHIGDIRMTSVVSPLDGAVIYDIQLKSAATSPHVSVNTIEITSFAPVALAPQKDYTSHPAFSNLFVETARLAPRLIIAKRRPRKPGESSPMFAHWMNMAEPNDISIETDRASFFNRDGTLRRSADRSVSSVQPSEALSYSHVGAVVDPCMSFRVKFTLSAQTHVVFGFAAAYSEQDAITLSGKYASHDDAERAMTLAVTQADMSARHLGLSQQDKNAAQSLASYILYNGQPDRRGRIETNSYGVRGLWSMGISGDLPIISATISDKADISFAVKLLRSHEYLRRLGLWYDLAFIAREESGYEQPIATALREAIAASPARDLFAKPSGVYLFKQSHIDTAQLATLCACSKLNLDGPEAIVPTEYKPYTNSTPTNSRAIQSHSVKRGNARRSHVTRAAAEDGGFTNRRSIYQHVPLKPLGELRLPNGFGGFLDGDITGDPSYVITKTPPAPWSNILANPKIGCVLTDRGAGFMWAGNSGLGRLTAFSNDPVLDRLSEAIYIQDDVTGLYCSPTPAPCGENVRVRHYQGSTTFESGALGLYITLTVFADAKQSVICRWLKLKNPGRSKRTLSTTAFIKWQYIDENETRLLQYGMEEGIVWAKHPDKGETLFISMNTSGGNESIAHSESTDILSFLGTGGIASPHGMTMTIESNELTESSEPNKAAGGGVLRSSFEIMPGQEIDISILTGVAGDDK
ncbi:hypothetical protein FACS18948_0220 [Clostridia bacterium]|nr:hypothetical protein FACS18948_0220 [Clostridia bacterium]